jgi:cyanophycinase
MQTLVNSADSVSTGCGTRHAMLRGLSVCITGLALATSFVLPAEAGKVKAGYDYYLTGNPADVQPARPTTQTAVLMGGGTDVDAAFQWMIQKSGGGNFVVIRATGADGYNPYIYAMGGVTSIETLVIKTSEAAADPFVLDRVSKADALFIAGGDQADYIRLWKGTALATELETLMANKVPVGGTSAGLAVLGQFDFAALSGSVTSAQALANPYNRYMTLDQGFVTVPGLANTITDSHFGERDRMGRLLTFVARIVKDGWATAPKEARGIGIDSETALLMENGVVTRVGVGSAYFINPTTSPVICTAKQPLTFRNVMVQRLSGSGSFNLNAWTGSTGAVTGYDVSAETGVLTSSQLGGSPY